MGKKQVFAGGTIDAFEKRLAYYAQEGSTFEVRKWGMTRRISFPNSDITWKFFGTSANRERQFVDGSWFAAMVRKEVDVYIAERGVIAQNDKPDIQQFNMDMIRENLGKRVTAIDINSCHWTTAYHLGFISETTFLRGIKSAKKKGLLVSIGSLNKLEQIDVYREGQLVETYYDHAKHEQYSPFYWAVIGRVRDVMMELYEAFTNDFYMWLTDCAFVAPERAAKVSEFLTAKGYKSKQYDIDYKDVTKNKVVWYDPKSPHDKFIGYHGRDIETNYILWKQMQR
jgi:hypothetical protein